MFFLELVINFYLQYKYIINTSQHISIIYASIHMNDRHLQISRTPLKRQVQDTSLFTNAATNLRGLS